MEGRKTCRVEGRRKEGRKDREEGRNGSREEGGMEE